MLERMYEVGEYCETYSFYESIEAVDEKLIDNLYTDINIRLSKFWCGHIHLLIKNGFVTEYRYTTEDNEELERIDDIKAEITEILKTFQITH